MHESLLKPPRLKQGATIGVIAPSSFPYYPEFSLFQGLEHLKKLGYKVVLGQTLRKSLAQGYHSASDEERAQELNWAFRDSSIDAVFCARGGGFFKNFENDRLRSYKEKSQDICRIF
ncbi:hypothetical protein B9P99_01200 [Candidatus Marsarchaeota G1 archaeon OSP_B]|jgi:Uncharacterized proteins, homologs of microcin C7 resistance protein MccF|uniref:LD-carboxypeptidase N-terminal domain-containing protein n=1 Tax=Candidatus Marsarchaeota G1 archaeon OSP_B TaxID=1978153 RepID=A0A2R6B9Z0_9ARCH|nr:MAG: hypothetical protein B9P99_01200 [Candidatus Marsarchaeota G1 archaeon OSP_B]